MTRGRKLNKPLLYALIGSVVFGAALGIFFVLGGTWNWFEVRVILTTLTIAAASLCGLACELSKTPLGLNLLPKFGLVVTGLAAVMLLIGIWADINGDMYWKLTTCTCIFSVATVHVSLLSIAKLGRSFQWVYTVACQIIFGLAALLVIIILAEIESDTAWRLVAALSIVVAAITLVIPILHRIGKMEAPPGEFLLPIDQRNVAAIDSEIEQLGRRMEDLKRLRAQISGGDAPAAVCPKETPLTAALRLNAAKRSQACREGGYGSDRRDNPWTQSGVLAIELLFVLTHLGQIDSWRAQYRIFHSNDTFSRGSQCCLPGRADVTFCEQRPLLRQSVFS